MSDAVVLQENSRLTCTEVVGQETKPDIHYNNLNVMPMTMSV